MYNRTDKKSSVATLNGGGGGGGVGPFMFIKNRGSIRKELKRQHSHNDPTSPGTLGRWLRDLRPGSKEVRAPPPPEPPLDRAHPVYHSEGKGLRRRKDRDRRRHSFNEQQPEVVPTTTSPPTTATPTTATPRSVVQNPNGRCTRSWQMARDVVASPRLMMAAHAQSTPNLQLQQPSPPLPPLPPSSLQQSAPCPVQRPGPDQGPGPLHATKGSIYSYLHNQSGLNFAPVVHPQHWDQQQPQQQQQQNQPQQNQQHCQQPWPRDAGSPPPAPPVRDSSSLKGVKYGPGHEKFPSWPMSPTADPTAAPAGRGAPGGGSHRSKSWTDHTNYPKENGIPYTRPYMKRPNPSFSQQQLKTVMERCEKISPETYQLRDKHSQPRLYLPRVDREGKLLGDSDYMVPSPPERDVISTKPHLTQADLEEYAKSLSTSYRDPQLSKLELEEYAMSYQEPKPPLGAHLTQADLEEYSRSYDEALRPQHAQQPSYAQSEGYHSYVSSTDSTMATPFMDRLRRDSEAVRAVPGPQTVWCDEPDRAGRDSVVTTSSGSASSSETLKWHGSLSDVSVTSSSYAHHQGGSSSRQLIAHSAKVQSPQRHNSESVLFPGTGNGWQSRVQQNNNHNKLRLFPVHTYTIQPDQSNTRLLPVSPTSPQLSVAERISELEKQSRYSYLDPDKRHRVSDPTLKAIQKKAILSFYERHHSTNSSGRHQTWRSEPLLAQPATLTLAPCPQSPPPQPPPRPRSNQTSRRASSASDYAANWRDKAPPQKAAEPGSIKDGPRHQHSNSCGSLAMDSMGPLIVGPTISLDDWVPERPPKKPHLRAAFPPAPAERLPSPDLPPPSPPPALDDEVFAFDEPLPPPPPEVNAEWTTNSDRLDRPQRNGEGRQRQDGALKSQRSLENGSENGTVHRRSPSSPAKSPTSPDKSQTSPIKSPNNRTVSHTFARTLSMKRPDNDTLANCGVPPMKLTENNWSAFRYQTQKLMINGKIATSLPVHEAERADNRNGNAILPSKARLQRIPSDKNVNGGPLPRSPSHAKANESRLRSLNIRDSFRNQKARNALARSPPEGRPSQDGVRRSPPSSLRLEQDGVRRSPPSSLRPEHSVNGRADSANASPTDVDQRSVHCANSGIMSTSKASYLAYKRESHRESSLPNFEGSYKRTMSPSEVVLDNHTHADCDRLSGIANFSLPAPMVEKLSPSHNKPHQPMIKDRNIILPTVIKDRQPVKPSNDALIQRVSIEEIKQFINIETVSLKANAPSPTEAGEEVNKLSDEIINCAPAVNAAEVETQCDMNKCESERDLEPGAVVLVPTRSPVPRPAAPSGLASNADPCANAAKSDASSQTEKEAATLSLSSPVRPKLQEEIDCERLSLALANQLPATDKLQGILVPAVDLKKPADYVAGLFRLDIGPRPRTAGLASPKIPQSPGGGETPEREPSLLPASSVYFTTSESKAKFLARFSTDMSQSEQLDGLRDNKDLHRKKEELMSRLDSKLIVLRAEHLDLSEESRKNEQLGESVSARVSSLARPHEAAKFRLHVEEVGKITSLLLGLSGRLARVENALVGLPDQHSEKKILESKRDKLKDQLEEAKKLKENIDRRSVFVSNILNKYFNFEEHADYDHFINMKAKLIIDSREIADKIKLGEEQLTALKDTLSSSEGS